MFWFSQYLPWLLDLCPPWSQSSLRSRFILNWLCMPSPFREWLLFVWCSSCQECTGKGIMFALSSLYRNRMIWLHCNLNFNVWTYYYYHSVSLLYNECPIKSITYILKESHLYHKLLMWLFWFKYSTEVIWKFYYHIWYEFIICFHSIWYDILWYFLSIIWYYW